MQKDLIRNDFIEDVDVNILKKIIKLFQYAITLSCVYHSFIIYEFYKVFIKSGATPFPSFYMNRIYPFVILFTTAISIYAVINYFKVYKTILLAIENKNATTYNKANKMIYRNIILTIIVFIALIINNIIRYMITIG